MYPPLLINSAVTQSGPGALFSFSLVRCNYTLFILSVNCCTYFGWFLHPSSGALITVSTASGTSQRLLLPVGIVGEIFVPLMMGGETTRNMYSNLQIK